RGGRGADAHLPRPPARAAGQVTVLVHVHGGQGGEVRGHLDHQSVALAAGVRGAQGLGQGRARLSQARHGRDDGGGVGRGGRGGRGRSRRGGGLRRGRGGGRGCGRSDGRARRRGAGRRGER